MTPKAMTLSLLGILVVSTAGLGSPTASADGACMDPTRIAGPRIGLVLGGGGARGAAHIGVIRRLEELRVPVHYISGTSMGSLVGGFYATGMNADELQQTVEAIDFEELFKDSTRRQETSYRRKRDDDLGLFGPKFGVGPDSSLLPRGAVHGQKISFLFERLTSARTRQTDFDLLPIPYRAVAADIETGEAVVMGAGSLSMAMRASMSVPGVFDPVEWDQHLLVDGGIANNLPIDVARGLGAEVVIAVEVGTPPLERDKLKNAAAFVGQLSSLMISRNSEAQIATLEARDTLIRPALGHDISSAEFSKAKQAIAIGYQAALAASEQLARYSISEADYARYRQVVVSCVQPPPTIQFVELDNRSRFSDEVIEKRMDLEPGQPIDSDALKKATDRVYGLGFLDLVRNEVVERDGSTGVVTTVEQDARGTNFIESGVDIVSDGNETTLDLRAAFLKTDLDEYGSEFRAVAQLGDDMGLGLELYKALGPDLQWFLRPRLTAVWRDYPIFDGKDRPQYVAEIRQYTGDLALVREFSDRAAVWAGMQFFDGEADPSVGTIAEPLPGYRGGQYRLGFDYDGVDDRYFPAEGVLTRFNYLSSRDELGADAAYDQISATLLGARTFGRQTLIGNVRYGSTLNGTAPYYARFLTGGLFNLSGLRPNQLAGSQFGIAMASWRYEVVEGAGLFPAFVGLSAEYGDVSEKRDDLFDEGIAAGSVYFAYRSPIGPLYWGVGFAEGGERAYFLRIGNIFGQSAIAR